VTPTPAPPFRHPYPGATLHPLKPDHFSPPAPGIPKDTIVLHITEGSTAAGAIATFETSQAPRRVSAHFVIDRDGTVYQLVEANACAWHASECNARSIGIEHVAEAGKLLATNAQYKASANLVAWLCTLFTIPCDRQHVRTHNEASPKDGHVMCCTGALNPDLVVKMAQIVLNPNQGVIA